MENNTTRSKIEHILSVYKTEEKADQLNCIVNELTDSLVSWLEAQDSDQELDRTTQVASNFLEYLPEALAGTKYYSKSVYEKQKSGEMTHTHTSDSVIKLEKGIVWNLGGAIQGSLQHKLPEIPPCTETLVGGDFRYIEQSTVNHLIRETLKEPYLSTKTIERILLDASIYAAIVKQYKDFDWSKTSKWNPGRLPAKNVDRFRDIVGRYSLVGGWSCFKSLILVMFGIALFQFREIAGILFFAIWANQYWRNRSKILWHIDYGRCNHISSNSPLYPHWLKICSLMNFYKHTNLLSPHLNKNVIIEKMGEFDGADAHLHSSIFHQELYSLVEQSDFSLRSNC